MGPVESQLMLVVQVAVAALPAQVDTREAQEIPLLLLRRKVMPVVTAVPIKGPVEEALVPQVVMAALMVVTVVMELPPRFLALQ